MKEFGERAELLAADKLRLLGYVVDVVGFRGKADLLIRHESFDGVLLTAEVKAARLSEISGRQVGYQFLLDKVGYSAPIVEDVLLLACVDGGAVLGWFVIPSLQVVGQHKLAISSRNPMDYCGRWSKFRERWELLPILFQLNCIINA